MKLEAVTLACDKYTARAEPYLVCLKKVLEMAQ